MDAVIFHVIAWPTLGSALLVFGFAPGAVLRLIVLLYPRGHPRRRELLGELYAYPRIERPFWVAEQLETALFEGLPGRLTDWRARRPIRLHARVAQPGLGRVLTLQWSIPAKLRRVDVQRDDFLLAFEQAVSTGQAKPVHFAQCPNHGPCRKANLAVLLLQLREALNVGAEYAESECAPEVLEDRRSICVSFAPADNRSPLGGSALCPVCETKCQ